MLALCDVFVQRFGSDKSDIGRKPGRGSPPRSAWEVWSRLARGGAIHSPSYFISLFSTLALFVGLGAVQRGQ
eukprot:7049214-Pyramimonas_sp.AAC.1